MQPAPSKFWTRVTVSIHCNDRHYTTWGEERNNKEKKTEESKERKERKMKEKQKEISKETKKGKK